MLCSVIANYLCYRFPKLPLPFLLGPKLLHYEQGITFESTAL
jgi:hypothetical protein